MTSRNDRTNHTGQGDYYRILHVQPDAPLEVIRSSYRTLMQRMRAHPDLGGDNRRAAALNEAWSVLRHPEKRASYDAARRAANPSPRPSRREPRPAEACLFCGMEPVHAGAPDAGERCGECASPLAPADRRRLETRGQRAIARIRRSQPITFLATWPQHFPMTGRMQDVSLHGLKFVTRQALSAGQIIRLDCDICRAVARVVAVQPSVDPGDRQWLVRAEFLTLDLERTVGAFVCETA
ncbi:J domain-containing protein [Lentisalinibacter salinarum]|uniref:J domain-containing protein n=1 Tax=Lentisalinibacter salinarum TaxID=2992239 RepID=UPI00386D4BEA